MKMEDILNREEARTAKTNPAYTPALSNRRKWIHYGQILPNPNNREINREKVKSIAESILTHGRILEDITVVPLKNENEERYMILAGHHRYYANLSLVEAGHTDFEYLKCSIANDDPIENELIVIDTNLERSELTAYEKMMAIGRKEELLKEQIHAGKRTMKEKSMRDMVAKESNLKPTQTGAYLRIYKKGCAELKQALKKDQITLENAAALALKTPQQQCESLAKLSQKAKTPSKKRKDPLSSLINETYRKVSALVDRIYDEKELDPCIKKHRKSIYELKKVLAEIKDVGD